MSVYNNIAAKKELLAYPDFGHEYLPGFDDERYCFWKKNSGGVEKIFLC